MSAATLVAGFITGVAGMWTLSRIDRGKANTWPTFFLLLTCVYSAALAIT